MNIWTGIFAAAGMAALILDSQTAVTGASAGMELCIRSVIPSLFPFFVLSGMLNAGLSGVNSPILRVFAKLFRIPKNSESVLICGFLGGYPVGAKSIASLENQGYLVRQDAERMLAFCSNAGPAFIFGIAGSQFECPWAGLTLWCIHILSALAVARIIPGKTLHCKTPPAAPRATAAQLMQSSIGAMASVCGWVVTASTLNAFLEKWILRYLPNYAKVVVTGVLELTGGCCMLTQIPDEGLRFVTASAFLAFGGLCVVMQTISVTKGLSIRMYVKGKLLQTLFSIILSSAIITKSIAVPLVPAILAFIFHLLKKSIAIRRQLMYNQRNAQEMGILQCCSVKKSSDPAPIAPMG